jgi:DNA-binding Xre family transcriptional regulator
METIQIQVTKLFQILSRRGMTQKDLHNLIAQTNNGENVSMYILNEIINGKRKNFNIKTLKLIKNALQVSFDDLIDE